MRSMLAFALLFTFSALPAHADKGNWPQFRGPKRDGLSMDKGLLKEWPQDGPPVVWKCEGTGTGFSSVSVADGRVFTMGDLEDGCYAMGIDEKSGEMLWKTRVGNTGGNYKGPRSTPTVDGSRVYVLGQFGDLLCLEAGSGKEIWKKSLPDDFGGKSGGWNFTESVLIDGDKLLCTPGGKQSGMLALNKNNGEVIWKSEIEGGGRAGYSSIVPADIGGVHQYIQLMADGVFAVAANDGRQLWSWGTNGDRFKGNTANIPTPIVRGDHVFVSAGYGRGGGLVKVTKNGSEFSVDEVYFERDLNNKHGGVILVGDYVYGDHDARGMPFCANFLTGEIKWKKEDRDDGRGSASLVYADGKLIIRYDNGYVALCKSGPNGYEQISGFKIPNAGSHSWPHPVVTGGKLYLREQNTLWCYDLSAK